MPEPRRPSLRGEGTITAADRAAILAAARDYIESWLDGDADRMARCLHLELVKRSVEQAAATAECTVETITRDQMIDATGTGQGRHHQRPFEISILDAYGDIACVRVLSTPYMDYLHVARCGRAWLLLNVLWQPRVGFGQRRS
ncbi:MAG: nuclear transport factor 2 family protein [Candidatus Limnocylindrales bacterium]